MKLPVPEYGDVPPVALTVTDAVPPLHAMLPAVADAETAVGWEMVPDAMEVHPLASVTV